MLTFHLLHHLERLLQCRDNRFCNFCSVLMHVLTSSSYQLLRFLHNWLDFQDVERTIQCSRSVSVDLVQIPKCQVLLHVLQECRHECWRHDRVGAIHWIFEIVQVCNHMSQLILDRERTDWLTDCHCHILERRIHVLHILWVWQHFVHVWQLYLLKYPLLNSESIVQIRVSSGTSSQGLYLCIALAFCKDVWVRNRDNVWIGDKVVSCYL